MKSAHIFLSLFFIACLAQVSFGQITGTDHDFSGRTWNSSGEICIVCHTPHNANGAVTGAPLWNHQVTGATFTPYSSTTLDATVGQPAGNSKLCLSCHDGTVAVENYGNVTNGAEFLSGSELIGTDLSNDHPISFSYDATLASTDGGLYDPTTQTSGLGGTIGDDMLFAGQLECASCHDVHNGAGYSNFLRKSNSGSALCLTCHNK
ncbi:MAG: cytochrome c3 family protein [Chlorobi bacterium]|nr:cytochrome c3 family protein [Chlorobiota bacterium]